MQYNFDISLCTAIALFYKIYLVIIRLKFTYMFQQWRRQGERGDVPTPCKLIMLHQRCVLIRTNFDFYFNVQLYLDFLEERNIDFLPIFARALTLF